MKIIDLTHLIEENMPVYPGTQPPRLFNACTLEKDGFREKHLMMYSHTGTHMDAPAHMLKGPTLDTYDPERFIGKTVVLHADGDAINKAHLMAIEGVLRDADFLLVRTGWDSRWGKDDYFSGFPALTLDGARYLLAFDLKGYGIDAISVDTMGSSDFEVHRILLGQGMVLIENLTNLDQVRTGDTLVVMPLKIKDADGSPVRAVAISYR